MQKNLSLIVKANQDFIRHTGDDKKKNAPVLNLLYESISSVYIPFLRMVEKLEQEGIGAKIGLVLPPILCNLLDDEVIQNSYIEWLENRNQLGLKELERNKGNDKVLKLIQATVDENTANLKDFTEKYNKKLISTFSEYMKKGLIELIGTTGTDIYMPHYADMKEIISAQVESGLHAYRQSFGIIPDGFWLPEFGYTPGIEKLIKAYGYTYTVLDPRSVLLAEKLPESGVFYPSRTENSLVIFTRCKSVEEELYGEEGYIYNSSYRNQNRDIGYELDMEQLSPIMSEGDVRYSTGYKYWNRCFDDTENAVYDIQEAKKQVEKDAEDFVCKRLAVLDKAADLLKNKNFVTSVCTFDTDKFCKNWYESIDWLEQVIRISVKKGLSVTSCDLLCGDQFNLERISPYYSAGIGAGYGENLLSSKNCWMMRYIRKSCERMIDLADRFPSDTGLKNRLLNLGAKELMLAQSCNISKNIDRSEYPAFAARRFKE